MEKDMTGFLQQFHFITQQAYYQPMKKMTPAQVKKKLWDHCKRITRKRYARPDGTFRCYTCGRAILEPKNAHTGHFIPSGACGAFLRYDLRNLRVQCYFCNINCGGQGAEYYRRMIDELGQEEVDQIFRDKQVIVNASDHNIRLLIQYETL